MELLLGEDRERAIEIIRNNHYTRSVPSGKSYYIRHKDAIIVWSIPANKNISNYILGYHGKVWELSRLWAPDGHEKNLLTEAISKAVFFIRDKESPDALVSYADPNVGHGGGVYRAASWAFHGQSEESRSYRDVNGNVVSRRAFHSGKKGMRKAEIEAMGYTELKLPGKLRFVRILNKKGKKT